jgi:biotin carboxyl carrier protein
MQSVLIDGAAVKPAEGALVEVAPGVFSVLDGGLSYEVRVSNNEAVVNGHRFLFEIGDPRQWKPSRGAVAANAPASILAPMPGKVVRILVSVGDIVIAGQGIVVVEAMKMQNELKSPREGRVTAIKASIGASVNGGAVLATIEPIGEPL